MTGNLYIDGLDVHGVFGIVVTRGSYRELVAYPALKEFTSNNWAEEDGEEVDLSNPTLNTREVTITFAFRDDYTILKGFIGLITAGVYHEFEFTEIGKRYLLRLVSQPDIAQTSSLVNFSMRFADDFPLLDYSAYTAPQSGVTPHPGYRLDGRELSSYGLTLLRGSEAELKKMPAVKSNLLQNINSQSGAMYDDHEVFFQAKEVRLSCLMRAQSLVEFWRNYHALLYDLVRPGERTLYVDRLGGTFPCYYKKCDVAEFYPTGKIWLAFSLTLVFTSFRQ